MTKESSDEVPKRKTAKKLVAEKRKYFMPESGRSIEADSPEEAAELLKKQQEGVGDGE